MGAVARHVHTALVVEDNAALRETLSAALGSLLACQVRNAAGVAECLQVLEHAIPDFILLDVELADGTAFDILEHLQGVVPAPVVVAISGAAGPGESFRLAQLGIRRYVAKPADLTTLESAVRAALAEGPDLRPHLRAAVGTMPMPELEQFVRTTMLEEALGRSRGNRRGAARLLQVSRQLLQHMIRKLPSSL
ncbi:MAG: two-component system, response regulator [Myxococcaceae bacterium]|nr:two-component system, response regulator [Myxococcaceae bacterium]